MHHFYFFFALALALALVQAKQGSLLSFLTVLVFVVRLNDLLNLSLGHGFA